MKKVNILLQSINDTKDFVNIVNRFPYNIDLCSGRYVIDAKSIMGIFSLDISNPVEMIVYDENPEELLKEIDRFIVK
ncbi:MAG: HPr family phosphocarrier protein [Firmicutes bacterium]|uniref:HPr family phosphocarrier protein n=1 Tax=Candidatus Scybalomonas excrementavium TaxID=2840943 RepID=A0A9D9I035_9FIRM|nr:HPr family phosphocarrier protein [Candidatus Scybalomonas excrementavium]